MELTIEQAVQNINKALRSLTVTADIHEFLNENLMLLYSKAKEQSCTCKKEENK